MRIHFLFWFSPLDSTCFCTDYRLLETTLACWWGQEQAIEKEISFFVLLYHFYGVKGSFLALLDHALVKNWGNNSFLCLKISPVSSVLDTHSPKCCFSLLFLRVLSSCFSWNFSGQWRTKTCVTEEMMKSEPESWTLSFYCKSLCLCHSVSRPQNAVTKSCTKCYSAERMFLETGKQLF